MKRSVAAWSFAGVLAGFTGLAVNYALAEWWGQTSAVVAVADVVRDHSPADLVNWARQNSGKKITIPAILLILAAVFALAGRLGRRSTGAATAVFAVVAVLGAAAVLTINGAKATDLVAVGLGLLVMLLSMAAIGRRLSRLQSLDDQDVYGVVWRGRRRDLLGVIAAVAGVAVASTIASRFFGQDVRKQKAEQQSLRLPVSKPVVPSGAELDVDGAQAWQTPADEFYLIDTAFSRPVVLAEDWELRIHGMVEREIVLTYNDLIAREGAEAWITLNCVSNEVGGDLVGNAWWSGVLLAPLLAEAGPQAGADAVLQTSVDGWDCATPLEVIMDGRQAMLAVAMNGDPLPRDHGYPVRTIVPGLYGYVSGTKWVVDMEVTTFDQVEAYWTQRGWGVMGPIKTESRIDVPRDGSSLEAGPVTIAGVAWRQHVGIKGVEVRFDEGPWQQAQLATVPNVDTWVQWTLEWPATKGDHLVQVRATDATGTPQTSEIADVLPDGATGYHGINVRVT